jgi:hypothetical protein
MLQQPDHRRNYPHAPCSPRTMSMSISVDLSTSLLRTAHRESLGESVDMRAALCLRRRKVMLITRQLTLILSSAVLLTSMVACSGAGEESEASLEPTDVVQPETSADVVEKQSGFTSCYGDQEACVGAKRAFESDGDTVCGPCTDQGSCGPGLYTLFCDAAP